MSSPYLYNPCNPCCSSCIPGFPPGTGVCTTSINQAQAIIQNCACERMPHRFSVTFGTINLALCTASGGTKTLTKVISGECRWESPAFACQGSTGKWVLRFEGLSAGQVFLELIVDGDVEVTYTNVSTWNCLSSNEMEGGKTNKGSYYCEVCIRPIADCTSITMPTFSCTTLPNLWPFVSGQFAGAYSLCLSSNWSLCSNAFDVNGPTLADPTATEFINVVGGIEYVLDPIAETITVTSSDGNIRVYVANPSFCPLGETRFDLDSVLFTTAQNFPCFIKATAQPCWGGPSWRYGWAVGTSIPKSGDCIGTGLNPNCMSGGVGFSTIFAFLPQGPTGTQNNRCEFTGGFGTNGCFAIHSRLWVEYAAGLVTLRIFANGVQNATNNVARYEIPYASWDWFGSNILELTLENTDWCEGWPETTEVVAISL